MSESELHRLLRESEEWTEQNGHKGYYFHECPGSMDEHNRLVRIMELRGVPPAHQDPNPPHGSSEYWDRKFPVDM